MHVRLTGDSDVDVKDVKNKMYKCICLAVNLCMKVTCKVQLNQDWDKNISPGIFGPDDPPRIVRTEKMVKFS